MKLEDASIYQITDELRNRKEVIAVQVWTRGDIDYYLYGEGFKTTDDNINKVIDYLGDQLEDCESGNEKIQNAIWSIDDELEREDCE